LKGLTTHKSVEHLDNAELSARSSSESGLASSLNGSHGEATNEDDMSSPHPEVFYSRGVGQYSSDSDDGESRALVYTDFTQNPHSLFQSQRVLTLDSDDYIVVPDVEVPEFCILTRCLGLFSLSLVIVVATAVLIYAVYVFIATQINGNNGSFTNNDDHHLINILDHILGNPDCLLQFAVITLWQIDFLYAWLMLSLIRLRARWMLGSRWSLIPDIIMILPSYWFMRFSYYFITHLSSALNGSHGEYTGLDDLDHLHIRLMIWELIDDMVFMHFGNIHHLVSVEKWVELVDIIDYLEDQKAMRTYYQSLAFDYEPGRPLIVNVPDTVEQTIVDFVATLTGRVSQINGSHGEYTGLDDIVKNQKSSRPVKPKNRQRKTTERIPHPEDDCVKKEHNKKMGFPMCREVLRTGQCDQCPSPSPREAIEIMRHFLAREGIAEPCPPTDGRFLSHCLHMLNKDGRYPQAHLMATFLRVPMSVPSDYQAFELRFNVDAVVSKDNLEFDHPPPAANIERGPTDAEQAKRRQEHHTLQLLPEDVVYEGSGVVMGLTVDLHLWQPPKFQLNSTAISRTWVDHTNYEQFLLQRSHPSVEAAALRIYNHLAGAVVNPLDLVWALIPFERRVGGEWVEHPRVEETDVTQLEPLSFKRSTRTPLATRVSTTDHSSQWFTFFHLIALLVASTDILYQIPDIFVWVFNHMGLILSVVRAVGTAIRLRDAMPKVWIRAMFMIFLYIVPIIVHVHPIGVVSLFLLRFIMAFTSDAPKLNLRGNIPIGHIPELPSDPLQLRHLQPKRNRLEPHPSNLVAGSVFATMHYVDSILVDVFFTCPEVLHSYLTVNDSSRPSTTFSSAWANIDSRNATIVYPPVWRLDIQQSWNYISLIQGMRVEQLVVVSGSPTSVARKFHADFYVGIVVLWFVAAGVHFGDPPILGWIKDLTMEGIHPNPGPDILNLFGYLKLVSPPLEVVKGAKFRDGGRKGRVDQSTWIRRPMFFAHSFYAPAVDPTPDIADPLGALNAAAGRVLAKTPPVDPVEFAGLMNFVESQVPRHFNKICPQELSSPEEWVHCSPYTMKQKQFLLDLLNDFFPNDLSLFHAERRREILLIMSFIKKEFYPDFKMYRCILGRNDLSKLLLGHVIKSIESVVYDHPCLVKHVPWHERPAFMEDKFARHDRFVNCDMSSYEASIKYHLTRIEIFVYSYITCPEIAKLIDDCLYNNTNEMVFAWFKLLMDACRASGDTTTALGNALITLWVWLYVLWRSEIFDFDLAVEGDDNLEGDKSTNPILVDIFVKLGLRAKLEYPATYSEAAFCGMIFNPCSSRILTDPRKVLNRFGWLDAKYSGASLKKIVELYRGKALCNLYQYRECPIIASFSRAVLRVTRKVSHYAIVQDRHYLNLDFVPRDESRLPPQECVDPDARILVENLFSIPSDVQVLYEDFFNSQEDFFLIPDYGIFSDEQRLNWVLNVSASSSRPQPTYPHSFKTYIKFLNFCSLNEFKIESLEDLIYSDDGEVMLFSAVSDKVETHIHLKRP
jgi:hypothetical protein